MYYTFTIPREEFDETNIDRSMILRLISKHYSIRAPKILKNVGYYFGKHAIMNREKKFKNQPNNKIMVNHAKDISDTATGYFLSNPITFKKNTEDGNIDKLTGAFVDAETDDTDSCNAINMSRAGVAYEYVYLCEHESKLMTKTLDPLSTFKVFDASIEQHELFSVYYSIEKDDSTDRFNIIATVTTENYVTRIGITCNEEFEKGEFSELGEPYPHFLGEDPIIEYRNNMDCIGDYEQQISLIDAYNTLCSDRINDKEQFIDAVLVVYGALLGDDDEEATKALQAIRKNGVMELPSDARSEYLTRTFDENAVETLKRSIKEDIYSLSRVPNLTDENFAGNSSGIAIQYKLLALETLTKTKERYYKKGLKKRIRMFCTYLNLKAIAADQSMIEPVFTRGLPQNRLELSQIIANLKGVVSTKTLLALLDFVSNVDDEMKEVKKEKKEALETQKQLFDTENQNTPPEDEEETDDHKEDGNNDDDKDKE